MDKEMFLFYRNSLARNLCKEYKNEFKKDLEDKKKLFELCLRQQSIPYFATACYQKWGLNIDFIKREYKDYINGKYIATDCDNVHGYSYGLWCDYTLSISANIDVVHTMECRCQIKVPLSKCPTIYISNNSNIDLSCLGYNSIRIYLFDNSIININELEKESTILIYNYSKNSKINIKGGLDGKIKEFDKELKL